MGQRLDREFSWRKLLCLHRFFPTSFVDKGFFPSCKTSIRDTQKNYVSLAVCETQNRVELCQTYTLRGKRMIELALETREKVWDSRSY